MFSVSAVSEMLLRQEEQVELRSDSPTPNQSH